MLRAACALRAAPRACAGSLHRAPLAVARASCPAGSRGSLLRPAARQLSTAAAEEAGLLARGQFDAGFFQGTALFAGVVLGAMAASDEQRASAINGLLAGFRSLGVSDRISDRQLIEDFLRKNVAAAANVVMASPVFYFLFAGITGESVLVSSLRAITGTMRIVPFMGAFYGLFAVCSPFLVDFFMARGPGGVVRHTARKGLSRAGEAVLGARARVRRGDRHRRSRDDPLRLRRHRGGRRVARMRRPLLADDGRLVCNLHPRADRSARAPPAACRREWPVDERGVGVPPQAGSRAACCCSSRRQAVARRGVPRLSHPTR